MSEWMFICLCCGQPVKGRGQPVKDPVKAWEFLKRLGYTRESLLTEHLANLDYTSPGFSDWLREHQDLA